MPLTLLLCFGVYIMLIVTLKFDAETMNSGDVLYARVLCLISVLSLKPTEYQKLPL